VTLNRIDVDDPLDPRLADYVGLTDAQLRRRHEGTQGVFVAEGRLVVERLLRSSWPVRSVLVRPERLADLEPALAGCPAPVYVASREVMRGVAGYDVHRGVLAIGERREPHDAFDLLRASVRVALFEGITDHENLGVLFRNAAALGIDGVLLDPTCADPLYRRAVRVSMGEVLHVPFARLPDFPRELLHLQQLGFTLIALTPHRESTAIDDIDPLAVERAVIALGNEARGLSAATLNAASVWARIPMARGVDSLNVAAAAAIAFHRFGIR
jgi:tRNA G18 (ribose-2'-O)-methylase SpoU